MKLGALWYARRRKARAEDLLLVIESLGLDHEPTFAELVHQNLLGRSCEQARRQTEDSIEYLKTRGLVLESCGRFILTACGIECLSPILSGR